MSASFFDLFDIRNQLERFTVIHEKVFFFSMILFLRKDSITARVKQTR